MTKRTKNVVVIGGGTGVFTVLTGIKNYPFNLTAILTMVDDGGSSGVLREEFGILPPGDIRRALLALAPVSTNTLAKLFNYRFKDGTGLKGHSFGNLFIAALERITGSFSKAVKEASKILGVKGQIIPVTLENTRLFAKLENGLLVVGEANIDVPKHDGHLSIKEVFLNPVPNANPEAIKAIKNADLIVMGPGDLYTSLLPNILVKGIASAIKNSRAKKVYFCNIMSKFGETDSFTARNFMDILEKYIGKNTLSYFVVNIQKPKSLHLKRYAKENKKFINFKASEFNNYKITDISNFKRSVGRPKKTEIITARLLRSSSLLRHDASRLAKIVSMLLT